MDETEGPGLSRTYKRFEPVSTTSIIFAVLGLMPSDWISVGGFHAFGPIAFTAVFSIVGVMFGFLTVFRHGELQDKLALRIGVTGISLGLIRLFIYPFLGW